MSKTSSANSMDQYSQPVRELIINYDERFPFVDGFVVRYSYSVHFLEKDNVAGNHYHERKGELFIPILGDMEVTLEDIQSKGQETIILKSSEHPIMSVPTGVAHKVRALEAGAVLLVLATSHAADEDEIDYKITNQTE